MDRLCLLWTKLWRTCWGVFCRVRLLLSRHIEPHQSCSGLCSRKYSKNEKNNSDELVQISSMRQKPFLSWGHRGGFERTAPKRWSQSGWTRKGCSTQSAQTSSSPERRNEGMQEWRGVDATESCCLLPEDLCWSCRTFSSDLLLNLDKIICELFEWIS